MMGSFLAAFRATAVNKSDFIALSVITRTGRLQQWRDIEEMQWKEVDMLIC
jgi:hypothetical protein